MLTNRRVPACAAVLPRAANRSVQPWDNGRERSLRGQQLGGGQRVQSCKQRRLLPRPVDGCQGACCGAPNVLRLVTSVVHHAAEHWHQGASAVIWHAALLLRRVEPSHNSGQVL